MRLHELDGRAIGANDVDHPRSSPCTTRYRLRRALCLPAVSGDPRQERVDVIDYEREMRKAWVERLGRCARPVYALILQKFNRLICQRHDCDAYLRTMRTRHLAEKLAPHLARAHELRPKPIKPKLKRLIEGGDREADVVGTAHLETCMFAHTDDPTGNGLFVFVCYGPYAAIRRLSSEMPTVAHDASDAAKRWLMELF